MSATPSTVQAAGEAAVATAAQAAATARRTFPRAVDFAKDTGVPEWRITELCQEAGLDHADVRALLDGGTL